MKYLAHFLIVLGTAALLDLQLAVAEHTLECYWCAGYRNDAPENDNNNTKACTLKSFDKAKIRSYTNTTTDEFDLSCVTASVWATGHNNDEPFTARFTAAHRHGGRPGGEFEILNADLLGEDFMNVAGKADTENRVYFGTEFCFTNLCNTHTYSGAATFSLPGIALLLLPALALRYSM